MNGQSDHDGDREGDQPRELIAYPDDRPFGTGELLFVEEEAPDAEGARDAEVRGVAMGSLSNSTGKSQHPAGFRNSERCNRSARISVFRGEKCKAGAPGREVPAPWTWGFNTPDPFNTSDFHF